ncbi:divergent polysaccharide deacetylase family protein [Colwellia sp. MSW7]|uniref:Divergent polysaccharide deacetylase family protein n=1 Tax=Colwellia maritima TaxID=2912588 RepID=A0ABS9WWE7_9GAMM|nr:divergent polysaccharide deacetylase family protein [Colwellia maritima]MCI2282190.1 divergent polysaccharide deacetylase family protein [Colwellia maritima]
MYFCARYLLRQRQAAPVRIAIIIDDIGYRYTDKNALSLPGAITYSILPHTPYGKRIAIKANANHKDVMLHIPMEAENGKKLGPGGLTSAMNQKEIVASLNASLTEIPFAIGINNHMGSHLTQLDDPMLWTMNFLKQHHLLFLDSKTSPYSKAESIARMVGVPVHNRHIFLDNQLTQSYITKQFQALIRQAKSQKMAIAIAHPHPETIQALKRLLPTLAKNNIELVPLSDLYSTLEAYQTQLVVGE